MSVIVHRLECDFIKDKTLLCFAYCVDFGFNVSTSTSFLDVIHESLQVLFHLVLVGGMFIKKQPYFDILLVDGCNYHVISVI